MTDTTVITSTRKVVTLMPPAQEPLPAPITIRKIIATLEKSYILLRSMLAKPAVRAETD